MGERRDKNAKNIGTVIYTHTSTYRIGGQSGESSSLKTKKGITLIALIVTIIILLILAGVAIATLFGENGILNRAATSGEETKRASAKERLQTELLAIQAEKLSNSQEVTIATLDEKKDELAAKDIQVADSGLPREVTLDGYTFNVKNDLTLEGEGTTIGNGGSGTSSSVNSGEGTSESITQKEGLYRFINGNEGFTTTVGEAELTSLGIKPRTYGGQDSNNKTYCKLEKVLSKSLELDDKFELSMSNFINNTNNSSGGAFTINLYKKENNDYIRNAYLKIEDDWGAHLGIV